MNPLVILTGPTAVGKTSLSLKLAKKIGGEIISADSMQVYRHMDIGTAKLKPDEMQGIRHHMIDILEPTEEFHVAAFGKIAKASVKEVCERGSVPIITGGTGFYIQALLYDIDFTDANFANKDDTYRNTLTALASEKGLAHLHAMLKEIDPEAAANIHENNQKRVIRALEFFHQTKSPISLHNENEKKRTSPYNFAYFVLVDEREKIYESINQRVDEMIASGLIDEVFKLRANGLKRKMVSMQGLGYKEILAYLDGEMSKEDAIILLKRDTRRFAKRQMTWFRREREVIWLNKPDYQDEEEMIAEMVKQLRIKEII